MPDQHDLTAVLAVFAARMAGGYAICLGLLGPRVTQGPWRTVSLYVIAGLSVVALAAGAPWLPCVVTGAAALLLQRAIAFHDLQRLSSTVWMLPLGVWLLLASEWPPGLDTFPSAIAGGGTLATMLLGHSYLTARGLSFAPLKLMAWVLFWILVVRALFLAPAFLGERLEMMDWVFLAMRGALGLALPLVLAWMVIQCVKIESNQSATGILYGMTLLVAFFGELIAVYLKLTRGILA
ncbi:MAG: hypothetical protein ACYTEZ_14635 [Planctomycetota bacterium]|jgi:hypothetical protein